jgi:hypothetical protein
VRLVVGTDWREGVANYRYFDGQRWHEVNNAPAHLVESIPSPFNPGPVINPHPPILPLYAAPIQSAIASGDLAQMKISPDSPNSNWSNCRNCATHWTPRRKRSAGCRAAESGHLIAIHLRSSTMSIGLFHTRLSISNALPGAPVLTLICWSIP